MLTPGTILQNRYRIVRQVGGGGMGTVYLAEDLRLPGRRCAVKEMSPAFLSPHDQAWAVPAFQREAHLLASLNHPNLAAVTDFFPEGGNWYLVMEFVEGETLARRLERSPGHRLPLPEALPIIRQLCDVLEYLHTRQPPVIFRDLKPSNIMLTPEGRVKLIDFGIARFFKPGQRQDTVNLGTPGYAAPEQYGGLGQSDPRTDIYSLGVLLHQMVTGYDPAAAAVPFPLPPPRSLMPGIPPEVERVILRATQIQPDARYPSIQALRDDLFPPTRALPFQPQPGTPMAVSPGVATEARAIPRGVWIGLAAGLLALGLCTALVFGTVALLREGTSGQQFAERATPTPAAPPAVTEAAHGGPTIPPTPTPSPTVFPCASHHLVYMVGTVGKSDIYVARGNGSNARCLVCNPDVDEAEPEWSPDGTAVVYQSDSAGSYDIWTIPVDGGTARPLTASPDLDEREPTWSPDGRQIAYRVNPKGADRNADGELWVMDASGNNAHPLGETGRSPAWSPDGSTMAFMSNRTGKWQIYIYDERGFSFPLTDCAVGCRWPAWSPDGRFIAYHSIVDTASMDAEAIWYIPVSGGTPVRLLAERRAGRPSWSSCGWIVFHSNAGIEVMREDGSGRFLLIPGDGWAAVWSR